MKIGTFEVSDETMHPAILEPEDLALTIFKTGTWRYMRPVYRDRITPCTDACPAGVKIRDYLELVRRGELRGAWELICEDNPLSAITGRVCYHPCETECNRGNFDQPIAIHSIERFVGDYGLELPRPEIKVILKKEKIAIVGSGPAGLTAGYYLAKQGYQVTIFEALPVVGGMLWVGIPEYRLPRDILQRSVDYIKESGVEIKTNTPIGKELSLTALTKQGYKAIFIAVGAHKSQRLGIPGEESRGVIDGVTFLRELNLGERTKTEGRVGIIGGGNVAIDAARSALRLGAHKVSILYRRSRAEMPAIDEEIEAALAEGIDIQYLVAPVEVLSGNGKVAGIKCTRMELGAPDASGRRRPLPIPGSEFDISVDTVIPAISQTLELSFIEGSGLEITQRGTIAADPVTLSTKRPHVFAGGDVCSGPARVVDAIAAGKKAALSIDAALTGKPLVTEGERDVVRYEELSTAYFWPDKRREASTLPLTQRTTSFDEVDRGLDKAAVTDETSRCFHCGACNMCGNCWFFCPDNTISKKDEHFEVDMEYCKGCGICAEECPCGVIVMEEESKWQ